MFYLLTTVSQYDLYFQWQNISLLGSTLRPRPGFHVLEKPLHWTSYPWTTVSPLRQLTLIASILVVQQIQK
jgi:hypothetical protein